MKFHNGFEKTWYFSNNKRTKSKEIWNNCYWKMSWKISNNYSAWFFLWQTEKIFNDLPWFSVCTSGRIASSTKTSTNLHCTVTAPTVHREFKHQKSLNMFFRRRIAIHKAHANVMTTGNHVFTFRALSTFVTRTPHRTNHPTRLLRRLGLLQHLWWSFIQAPSPSPSTPFVYRAIEPTNIHELSRARSAPIIVVI